MNDAAGSARTPVLILTGFLGAGKTTLLRQLIAEPQLAASALIINEIGDIGIDQLLVDREQAQPILLAGGCICCSLAQDAGYTLRDLHERRAQQLIPPFKRVVIETTGLADPGPILQRLLTDAWIGRHFSLGAVVGVVDALNILSTVKVVPEAALQIALADRVVLSKADLVSSGALTAATDQVRVLNPDVLITTAERGKVAPDFVLAPGARGQFVMPTRSGHDHATGIGTASLELREPLPWSKISGALDLLFARHQRRLLRLKGVLEIAGCPVPVVVHGVQGVFHPPEILKGWDGMERGSRLIMITRDADPHAMARELSEMLASTPEAFPRAMVS